jgi:hypothetical protein
LDNPDDGDDGGAYVILAIPRIKHSFQTLGTTNLSVVWIKINKTISLGTLKTLFQAEEVIANREAEDMATEV